MMETTRRVRSWFSENQSLVYFLVAQAVAVGTAAAAILAYSVKLETRVETMEVRGAAYTVGRMDEMKQRITVLEQQIAKNSASIERVVDVMTRELKK